MFLLDRMLVGGIRFVIEKLIAAVEAELDDDSVLKQKLLEAQMKLELGELDLDEFQDIEAEVLERLRVINERRRGGQPQGIPKDARVSGVEIAFEGGDEER